jgi:hypothetical protein
MRRATRVNCIFAVMLKSELWAFVFVRFCFAVSDISWILMVYYIKAD